MHVSDALISPPVAAVSGLMAISLIGLASKKIKEVKRPEIIPLMGVMGAFVFAAQMINFTIPGTGSSGHLIGGILLSAFLGPWCAFITLCSVLIVQCLIFADGGLLALGCNILNMAATSCLIAYPFIFRPIARNTLNPIRLTIATIIASIIALEIGALAVTLETELSGITALPFRTFIQFMLPIHVIIGLIEGIVSAALLIFVSRNRPSILYKVSTSQHKATNLKPVFIGIGILTLVFAGGFTFLASEYPDGLEWSIEKVSSSFDYSSAPPATAIMPDYNSNWAGIVGAIIVITLVWVISNLIFKYIRK